MVNTRRSALNYTCTCILTGHNKAISSVKFNNNGRLLGSAWKNILLYKAEFDVECASRLVVDLELTNHGKSAADGMVRIWTTDGNYQMTLEGHRQGISAIAWAPDSRTMVSVSDDRTARLWDVEKGICISTLTGHRNYVFAVDYDPTGRLVATGSFDTTARLWDHRTGLCITTLRGHTEPISAVSFSNDGKLLATSSYDGLCINWDTHTFTQHLPILQQRDHSVLFLKYNPNNSNQLLAALDNSALILLDQKGRRLTTYEGYTNHQYCAFASFSTNRKHQPIIVSGSEDGRVYMWDKVNGTLLAGLTGHKDVVLCCACHPTEAIIASGALENDATIRLWTNQPSAMLLDGLA